MPKPYVTCTVEDVEGRRYRCVGWGKDWVNVKPYTIPNEYSVLMEYKDVYVFREYNTEEAPIEFSVTADRFNVGIERKKIFMI